MNLTDVEFSKHEIWLLEKGFSYNLKSNKYKKDLEILGVECELVLILKIKLIRIYHFKS